jgi:fructokinase
MEIPDQPLVFCLGEILYDLLSDNPGLTLHEVISWTPFMGGAPANVAFALSKLEIPVGFIGKVGSDPDGKELVNTLKSHNINIEGVQWDSLAPTRKVYVERNLEGDRKFAGFGKFKTSEFADTFLDSEKIPYSLIANSKYLVLGTLLLAYPDSTKSLEKVMEFCVSNQISLILDINWREVFWENQADGVKKIHQHIQKATAIKFSKEEAELIYGTNDLIEISKILPKIPIILITDGDKGCHYKIMNHFGFVPAYKIKAIDTTGAGDSFLAGFIYQLIKAEPWDQITEYKAREMVQFASAMGALTTLGSGAILPQPRLNQVQEFTRNYRA